MLPGELVHRKVEAEKLARPARRVDGAEVGERHREHLSHLVGVRQDDDRALDDSDDGRDDEARRRWEIIEQAGDLVPGDLDAELFVCLAERRGDVVAVGVVALPARKRDLARMRREIRSAYGEVKPVGSEEGEDGRATK